jgi:dipeptidyl aminopeptidase/acylaminoacyl peptidase
MHAVLCSPYEAHALSSSSHSSDLKSPASTGHGLTILPVPLVPALSSQSQPTKLTSCSSLQVAEQSTLIILSGSPAAPMGIYRWDLLTSPDTISLLQSSIPLDSVASISSSYLSIPQHISFPTYSEDPSSGEVRSYGWYYPPTHPSYAPAGLAASSILLPPLLVKCHGGPTGSTSTEYRLDIQYFTSRGIAVLDVDYSGSSGYGREYRQRLSQKWGVYDRKDCVFGAKHLIATGLVDQHRVAIDGSSAGGYTTLAAITLEEEQVFTAATSAYGRHDPSLLPHSLMPPSSSLCRNR